MCWDSEKVCEFKKKLIRISSQDAKVYRKIFLVEKKRIKKKQKKAKKSKNATIFAN